MNPHTFFPRYLIKLILYQFSIVSTTFPGSDPDEDGEEALLGELNQFTKRNDLHGSHPDMNPNEGGKEAYVIEGELFQHASSFDSQ